jgi:hypothetical protein
VSALARRGIEVPSFSSALEIATGVRRSTVVRHSDAQRRRGIEHHALDTRVAALCAGHRHLDWVVCIERFDRLDVLFSIEPQSADGLCGHVAMAGHCLAAIGSTHPLKGHSILPEAAVQYDRLRPYLIY